MTFTRARHNPLSLVILNERHFCASEGPRRGARTGVPIMPAFGVMGWRCLAFFARQYSRVRHASLSSSGKARPAETPERSRGGGICFSPYLSSTRPAQLRNPNTAPAPFVRKAQPSGRASCPSNESLPKIPPLAGLDNFFRCGAGALARESFWVAQRFQRCDSMYVTEPAISPLSFRTGFSREESAFPSWRIPPFLILADALLSLRQTDSLTPQPLQGRNSDSPARKCRVSKGSRLRAPARHYTRHRTAPANQSSRAAGQSTSRKIGRASCRERG